MCPKISLVISILLNNIFLYIYLASLFMHMKTLHFHTDEYARVCTFSHRE